MQDVADYLEHGGQIPQAVAAAALLYAQDPPAGGAKQSGTSAQIVVAAAGHWPRALSGRPGVGVRKLVQVLLVHESTCVCCLSACWVDPLAAEMTTEQLRISLLSYWLRPRSAHVCLRNCRGILTSL